MTALVTADFHLSANPRDSYRWLAMEQIVDLIAKFRVRALIILGDLTEHKDYHSAELVNDVVELIYIFSGLCKVYIQRGNHDYTRVDCPFFQFTQRMKNVWWINEPIRSQFAPDMDGFFLPHTYNYERDWKLDEFDWKDVNWIFAHNAFEGASTESGKRLSGIPLSIFPPRSKIISGDIHKPQTIGERGRTQLTYVGSPAITDFGDDFEPRVLLLTGSQYESIPIPGPQKRLVELAPGFTPNDIAANSGDIVKVQYQLALKERDRWPQIKSEIRLMLTKAGLQVYQIVPVLEKAKIVTTQRGSTQRSDVELMKEFGRQRSIPEKTMAAGVALLQKS